MKIQIYPETGCLRVIAVGKFSLDTAKTTLLELLEAVARHKVQKVLVDGRSLKGKPETMERFYYGKFAAQAVWSFRDHGVSPVTQFAYVLVEPVLDPQRFGETVAVNRGMFIKVFEKIDEAYGWLGISSTDSTKTDGG